MANVFIDIAAEFTGKKAFKQAETSTEKLTKNVKQLAKTFGLAFGTAQVVAYGKASIKAAAADQKAQQQLALALTNVGLGRDAASSEDYIQRLQSEFGIVDDKLRPAYQTLAIATRDTVKSQKLLNVALDISAATGKDLGAVTTALSRAYLGNNTALSRLGVGISKADLKTKSFDEILNQLGTTFAGSATAAANSFQGSIDKLAVASANASEIIGTGLIDALKGLGDANSVDDLAKSMQDAALYTADVIRGIGVLTQKLQSLPGVGDFNIGMIPIVGSYLEILRGLGKQSATKPFTTPMTISGQSQQSTKITKEQTKLSKENLKVNKDSLKLAKAKAIFDLQKIQIEAALKGKLSEEDRLRLKLMQAIEEENITQIEKYTKLVNEAQAKTLELVNTLSKLKFPELEVPTILQPNGKEFSSFTSLAANTTIQPNLREYSSSFSPSAMNPAAAMPVTPSAPTVIVNVEGSVIAENNLAQTINDAIASSNQSGSAVGYKRQAGLTAV
jgi:hypothetical protein